MRSLFNEGSYEHSNPWTIIIILKVNMRHLVILIVLGIGRRGVYRDKE